MGLCLELLISDLHLLRSLEPSVASGCLMSTGNSALGGRVYDPYRSVVGSSADDKNGHP